MNADTVGAIGARVRRVAALHASALPLLTGPHAVGLTLSGAFLLLLEANQGAEAWGRLAELAQQGATAMSQMGHLPIAGTYARLAQLLRQEAEARR